jgi:protein O-GlcNAc transferase
MMSEELFLRAVSLHQAGDLATAERLYQEVLAQDRHHAGAMSNLGQLHETRGDVAGALRWYEAALQVEPGTWAIHYNRAQVLRACGRHPEAVESYGRALSIEPRAEAAALGLGVALQAMGQIDRAMAVYREACLYPPTDPQVRAGIACNQGAIYRGNGQFDEAKICYREALRLNSRLPQVWSNLAEVLFLTGQIDESLQCADRVKELDPDNLLLQSNVLFWQLYHPAYDQERLHAELVRWGERFAGEAAGRMQPHGNERSSERRLRMGFVSPDFRDHVVAQNLMPMFRNLDRKQFEVFCYSELLNGDSMTERIRQRSDMFRQTIGMSHAALTEQIRGDGIDILVDLALHATGNRLAVFARKPAPVQVTFAGYPGSTGLKAIDYRLTDPYLDPPEHDRWYVEKSVRLPASFWCYEAETVDFLPPGPLPALKNGSVTFGCLNSLNKVNDGVLALWGRVLAAMRGSRLVLLAAEGSHRRRTCELLARMGVAPQRVTFHTVRPRVEYLRLYQLIDIGLDTVPYNGHTTSLDSLFMGVPVVTLVGKTVVGRAGLSQLTNLGMPELIARTEEEFVAIAVRLAGDLEGLAKIRAGLRQRMEQSPLMDAVGFTRGIEAAFREMWRRWCVSRLAG